MMAQPKSCPNLTEFYQLSGTAISKCARQQYWGQGKFIESLTRSNGKFHIAEKEYISVHFLVPEVLPKHLQCCP